MKNIIIQKSLKQIIFKGILLKLISGDGNNHRKPPIYESPNYNSSILSPKLQRPVQKQCRAECLPPLFWLNLSEVHRE